MLRLILTSLIFIGNLLSTTALAGKKSGITELLLNETYVTSSTCRGGSIYWHIVATQRLNGQTKDNIIKESQIEDPKLVEYLDAFFKRPESSIFDYIVTQHGECIQGSLGIDKEIGSSCFKRYQQPMLFKVYGPNPAKKPIDIDLLDIDKQYINCLNQTLK